MHTQPQMPWIPLLPAPTGIRRTNPRLQGEIGLGDAIAWFSHHGYGVAVPLVDNRAWDLAVDDGDRLLRVQVKTATSRNPRGDFKVAIRTCGGNQSYHTAKQFDHSAVELLYVLTDAGDRYLIPTDSFAARNALTLNATMGRFKL